MQVAEKLIEAGAKLNEPNAHGLIPLHLAVQNGFNEMTSLLVQNGADLNFQVRQLKFILVLVYSHLPNKREYSIIHFNCFDLELSVFKLKKIEIINGHAGLLV